MLPNENRVQKLATVLKSLYDASSSTGMRKFGTLQSLVVEGMDEESMWEEIQTRIRPLINFYEKKTKKLTAKLASMENMINDDDDNDGDDNDRDADETSKDSQSEGSDDDSGSDQEDGEDGEEDEDQDEDEDEDEDEDVDEDEEDEDDGSDEHIGSEEENDRPRTAGRDQGYDSDEDLKMEAWLDDFEEMENKHRERQERREQRLREGADNYDSEDDEDDDLSIAMRGMYDSEGDDDEEDEEEDMDENMDDEEDEDDSDDDSNDSDARGGKRGKRTSMDAIRYEDFFVPEDKNKHKQKKATKHVRIRDDYDEMEYDDEQEEEDVEEHSSEEESSNVQAKSKPPTKFDQRSHALRSEVEELEDELLQQRSWELRGEVKATDRPENSLLNVVADIDRNTKAAPIITQEYTSSLEELIIRRITNDQFEDPVPGRPLSAGLLASKHDDDQEVNDLSQEKDKKGLGEVYAEGYAKEVLKIDDDASPEVEAARNEVLALFNKVSCLSFVVAADR